MIGLRSFTFKTTRMRLFASLCATSALYITLLPAAVAFNNQSVVSQPTIELNLDVLDNLRNEPMMAPQLGGHGGTSKLIWQEGPKGQIIELPPEAPKKKPVVHKAKKPATPVPPVEASVVKKKPEKPKKETKVPAPKPPIAKVAPPVEKPVPAPVQKNPVPPVMAPAPAPAIKAPEVKPQPPAAPAIPPTPAVLAPQPPAPEKAPVIKEPLPAKPVGSPGTELEFAL